MTAKATQDTAAEDRLAAILLDYVEAVQGGQAPDQRELLAAYPDLAGDLKEFFAGYDQLSRLAAPLRPRHEPSGQGQNRCDDPVQRTVLAAPGQEPAPGAANRDRTTTEPAAELGQLGDFRLLREVGRGGMGVVYEAEQISLRRQVALKILPFASAVDSRMLQRFRREAEAAAHLHHSNIVPVFAVGAERGVHYYAMQFIAGQSLAALIADLRRSGKGPAEPTGSAGGAAPATTPADDQAIPANGPPTGSYASDANAAAPVPATSWPTTQVLAGVTTEHSVRDRRFFQFVARIGKEAAEALEHAHQMGVLHRDVKPANLMLDERGHLWVTDFGLAQFRSDVGLTMTGELLGTLRYVSPEQALARPGLVDHRTDVYSLGATLYELLTLRPVFDGRDRQELLRQIAQDEVRPARSVDRSIPVELETILLKTLAKNPNERYSTAQELAEEFQRFLEDKPVLARRPTLRDRTRKWARRHKNVVATGVVFLFLAVIGLLGTTLAIARAQAETQEAYNKIARAQSETQDAFDREKKEAQNAHHEADNARKQRKLANQNFWKAKHAVDEFLEISEDELTRAPFVQSTRRRFLEVGLSYYQDFLEQHRDDPSTQAELAAGQARLARILGELSALEGHSRVQLLNDRAVQKDLELSLDQQDQIKHLSRKWGGRWRDLFQEFPKLAPDERQGKGAQLARSHDKAVTGILTAQQRQRLKQIAMQVQQVGPQGFRDPEIVVALKLTENQLKKIRKLQDSAETTTMQQGDNHEKGGHCSPQNVWQDTRDKALAVLTPEQRTIWRELTGTPIAGGALPRFGPGPGVGHPLPPPGGGHAFPPPGKGFPQRRSK